MNMFKTTDAKSPEEYIAKVDEARRGQIQQLHDLIRKTLPRYEPYLLAGMLAYGSYHYKTKSGREGDWSIVSLAPQKNYISLYVTCVTPSGEYLAETYKDKLPKTSIGKSCIRFKNVQDVDLKVIEELLKKTTTLSPVASA
jgi:hypothetical protein